MCLSILYLRYQLPINTLLLLKWVFEMIFKMVYVEQTQNGKTLSSCLLKCMSPIIQDGVLHSLWNICITGLLCFRRSFVKSLKNNSSDIAHELLLSLDRKKALGVWGSRTLHWHAHQIGPMVLPTSVCSWDFSCNVERTGTSQRRRVVFYSSECSNNMSIAVWSFILHDFVLIVLHLTRVAFCPKCGIQWPVPRSRFTDLSGNLYLIRPRSL